LFSNTSKEKKCGKKLGIIFGVASQTFIIKNLFMMDFLKNKGKAYILVVINVIFLIY